MVNFFLRRRIPISILLKFLPLSLIGGFATGAAIGFAIKSLGKTVFIPFFPNIVDFVVIGLAGFALMSLSIYLMYKSKAKVEKL